MWYVWPMVDTWYVATESTPTDFSLAGPCKNVKGLVPSDKMCSGRRYLAHSMGSGLKESSICVSSLTLIHFKTLDRLLILRLGFFIKWKIIVSTVKRQWDKAESGPEEGRREGKSCFLRTGASCDIIHLWAHLAHGRVLIMCGLRGEAGTHQCPFLKGGVAHGWVMLLLISSKPSGSDVSLFL